MKRGFKGYDAETSAFQHESNFWSDCTKSHLNKPVFPGPQRVGLNSTSFERIHLLYKGCIGGQAGSNGDKLINAFIYLARLKTQFLLSPLFVALFCAK